MASAERPPIPPNTANRPQVLVWDPSTHKWYYIDQSVASHLIRQGNTGGLEFHGERPPQVTGTLLRRVPTSISPGMQFTHTTQEENAVLQMNIQLHDLRRNLDRRQSELSRSQHPGQRQNLEASIADLQNQIAAVTKQRDDYIAGFDEKPASTKTTSPPPATTPPPVSEVKPGRVPTPEDIDKERRKLSSGILFEEALRQQRPGISNPFAEFLRGEQPALETLYELAAMSGDIPEDIDFREWLQERGGPSSVGAKELTDAQVRARRILAAKGLTGREAKFQEKLDTDRQLQQMLAYQTEAAGLARELHPLAFQRAESAAKMFKLKELFGEAQGSLLDFAPGFTPDGFEGFSGRVGDIISGKTQASGTLPPDMIQRIKNYFKSPGGEKPEADPQFDLALRASLEKSGLSRALWGLQRDVARNAWKQFQFAQAGRGTEFLPWFLGRGGQFS